MGVPKVLLATQEAVKHFGDGGSVINIGSAVTELNPPNSVVYTATKGAVDAVTRVLAKELGPRKIRVNSINPGVVETEGTNAAGFVGGEFEKQIIAQTPLGRTGQPDDIAPVAVFLASDESHWVTGDLLVVSGGLRKDVAERGGVFLDSRRERAYSFLHQAMTPEG
jgi:3-oxoacyl-[acyl-carrier protein] reductase